MLLIVVLCYSLSNSIPLDEYGNIDIDRFISMENVPAFIPLENNLTENYLEGKIGVDSTISTDLHETKLRDMEYYLSTITLQGGIIENNYAFGATVASGSGGGMFVSYCIFQADGKQQQPFIFSKNEATVGGGLCIIASAVLINNLNFEKNKAFKFGGAVYAQGAYDVYEENGKIPSSAVKFFAFNTTYSNNSQPELGGAICFSLITEVYLNENTFEKNKASFSGGAIFACNSDSINIWECNFFGNNIERDQTSIRKQNAYKENPLFKIDSPSINSRGGGAICFFADNDRSDSAECNKIARIYTTSCCFGANSAGDKSLARGTNSPGHAVLLDGGILYVSHYDNFGTTDHSLQVANAGHSKSVIEGNSTDRCDSEQMGTAAVTNATKFSLANSEKTITMLTSSVPEPTTFTYVATPITRLPGATTLSPKTHYSTAKTYISKFMSFPINLSDFTVHSAPTTFSPSRSPSDSPMPSPSRSAVNQKSPPPKENHRTPIPPGYNGRTKKINSTHWVPIIITSTSISFSTKEGGEVVEVKVEIPVISYSPSVAEIIIGDDDDKAEKGDAEKKKKLLIFIGAGVAGLFLIILIAIIVFFIARKNEADSDSSAVEMAEETIMQVPTSSSAPITNDNPLWTTSVMGDTDDPFKNDFEEDGAQGFFSVRENDEE